MRLSRKFSLLLVALFSTTSNCFQPHPVVSYHRPLSPSGRNAAFLPQQQPILQRSQPLHGVLDASIEKLPAQSVVSAVERLDATNGVLPSDVAAAAGISLAKAKQELTCLAAISRADLAVSTDGELIYKFPSGLSGILAQNSAQYNALQTFRTVWPTAFWAIRVSFGVTLLASLVAIFSAIFVLQSSSSDDDRRDNRGFGGGGGGMGWYFGPSPFDFFYYRPYGSYGYYNTNDDPEEMGFLESVFSYVFGDGDPNAGLEGRRLALAADMIRQNKGAVTAEQLAPFADDIPEEVADDVTYVDESFVLPIVSALGGEPVVTEDGEIVYVFSELQTSATSSNRKALSSGPSKEAMILKRVGISHKASSREIIQVLNFNGISTKAAVERSDLIELLEQALPPMTAAEEAEAVDADPTMLQEREWRFSLAPDTNKLLAGGLGILNVGGVLYLGTLLGKYAEYGVRLPDWIGTVQALYPLLVGYGILFNAIPLVRNLWIRRQNSKIQERNRRRRKWRDSLSSAKSRLAKKLRAASKMGMKMRRIGSSSEDIIFDTKKTTTEELQARRGKKDLEDFDRLLADDDDKPFQ